MKKSKRKSKKYLETNENGNTIVQNLWDTAKAVLREVHSHTCLPQEKKKKIPNKQSNLTPKGTRTIKTSKAQRW